MSSSEAQVRYIAVSPLPTNTKLFTTQTLYERATKAELAKDLDTAFRLYIQAGTAFLNLSRTLPANCRAQEDARQGAARAVERAERIKAVKADLAPVWRDPFALGSSLYVLDLKMRFTDAARKLTTTKCRGTTACVAKGVGGQRRRGAPMDDPFLESGGCGNDGDVVQVNAIFGGRTKGGYRFLNG